MESQLDKRVILHIDVDCFYAQVEESRRPELKGRPLGIFQKFLVVTCNYPARNAGVAKMCSKEDALRVCPDLVLINGEDLTPYRAVSKRILQVMRRFGVVERRGLDEAYLDVTEEVRKRMSFAMGPNSVYRGFVGKVLAGPQESSVVAAGPPERDRRPNSQSVLRGEPLEGQKLGSSQTGLSESLYLYGGLEKGTDCGKQTGDEGGFAGQPLETRHVADQQAIETRTGHVATQPIETGQVAAQHTTETGHVAGPQSTTNLASGLSYTPAEFEDEGSGTERNAVLTLSAESKERNAVGCCELVERFVPPGWRPLMRPRGSEDVSKSWRSGAVTTSEIAEPSGTTLGAANPAVKALERGGVSTNPMGALTDPTDANRTQNPNQESSHSQSPVMQAPDSAFFPTNPVYGNTLVTKPLVKGRHYGSLAEAFGGILKRPGIAPGESSGTLEPGAKRARIDPGIADTGKKLSWLDWRNEIDQGLPGGRSPGRDLPSPGHSSPGESPSGKLPGHWSDVRQVRFQPAAPDGVLQTNEKLDFGADVSSSDWLLLVGSHVSAEVRKAIWAEVGCRCSAGIAHNKMLAKLASPMNKPDGQTTMLTGAVAGHIKNLAARKIPGIGWSYDAKLREMKIDTISDLQKVALSELEEKFGARVGGMIYQCCRGEDSSTVEDKGPPKSLSVEDSFRACLNLKQAEGIAKALAADYIDRLDEEREDTGRRPKTLTVRWRQKGASYQGQSTSGPMPQDITALNLPKPRREEALVRSAMALLSKAFAGKKFHLVKLNVGATNFVEEPVRGTPSLLRSWVEKGTGNGMRPESTSNGIGMHNRGERSMIEWGGAVGKTESERNVSGIASNGNGMAGVLVQALEGVRDSRSGKTSERAEQSGTEVGGTELGSAEFGSTELGGTDFGGTAVSGTEPGGTEFSSAGFGGTAVGGRGTEQDGSLLAEEAPIATAEDERNGNGMSYRNGTGTTHMNGTAFSTDRSEATDHDRNGCVGPESADSGPSQFTRAAGMGHDSMLMSAQAPGGWAGVSPRKGLGVLDLAAAKGLGVSDAVAGSVLHANTGSKKEARAVREAVEGVKPVLGNGHEQMTASWHRLPKPGGLIGHSGEVSELDLYGVEPGGVGDAFAENLEPGFVRVKCNPGEDSDENEDLWDDLQSVRLERRGFRSDGWKRMSNSGGQFEGEESGRRKSDEPSGQLGDIQNGLAGVLSPSQIQPRSEAQLVALKDASKSVGFAATELEQSGVRGVLQKCSICGEVLSEDLVVRREHVDGHVAAQLQKEEDKLGALFKRLSGPIEKVSRNVSPSRNGSVRAPLKKRAVKSGLGTLDGLWKRDH